MKKSTIKWKTETRKISELKEHPTNPRTLSKQAHKELVKSFEEFDYAELIAINTDNTILAGHQRIRIMQELGWDDEIEVRVPESTLTDEQAKEYLIRSNKNTGDWDFDILANEFELPDLCRWGFEEKDFGLNDWHSDLDDGSDEPPKEPEFEILKIQIPLGTRTEIIPLISRELYSYDFKIL